MGLPPHKVLLHHSPFMSNVIVIQPGSKYLRIGRASDPDPQTILHAIARRRKTSNDVNHTADVYQKKCVHRDTLISLLPGKSLEDKLPPEVESARLQLCHTLQTSLKPDGSQRYITPTEQIAACNKLSKVEVLANTENEASDGNKNLPVHGQNETVVGDDVIKISTNRDYNIHFPWRRGRFNIHSSVGGSLTSIINDLTDIWEWTISEKLRIPLKNRSLNYRAIIVIPVMFDRVEAKELMNLVLNKLQFSHAFVVHDHVCATFAAALSCATVVDVGDQRISISCVEEGISLPQTRVELKYGGGDLALALWNLMSQSSVPFKVDLNSLWDINFLNKLKEELCHFDLSRCGPEEHTVLWDKPGEPVSRYNILVGDELLIVPLSYFNPDLLRGSAETTKSISVWKSEQAQVSDDPFDAEYISETVQRSMTKECYDEDDEYPEDIKDVELFNVVNDTKKIDVDQMLGIDQAILHSIECYAGEELKRRFYSCILVVGGGFKFQGLGSWLQNKIALNTPRAYRTDAQEVITLPKDKDPSLCVWRGGAIVSNLESAGELWINQTEWNTYGSRILRERSLCSF